jgi:hypothetical protein
MNKLRYSLLLDKQKWSMRPSTIIFFVFLLSVFSCGSAPDPYSYYNIFVDLHDDSIDVSFSVPDNQAYARALSWAQQQLTNNRILVDDKEAGVFSGRIRSTFEDPDFNMDYQVVIANGKATLKIYNAYMSGHVYEKNRSSAQSISEGIGLARINNAKVSFTNALK